MPGHYLCSRTSHWLVSVSQLNGFETNRSTSTTIQTISDCVCVCVCARCFLRAHNSFHCSRIHLASIFFSLRSDCERFSFVFECAGRRRGCKRRQPYQKLGDTKNGILKICFWNVQRQHEPRTEWYRYSYQKKATGRTMPNNIHTKAKFRVAEKRN